MWSLKEYKGRYGSLKCAAGLEKVAMATSKRMGRSRTANSSVGKGSSHTEDSEASSRTEVYRRSGGVGGADGDLGVGDGYRSRIHNINRTPRGGVGNDERVESHNAATTSPRCSFLWLEQLLEERLAEWLKADSEDYEMSIDELINDKHVAHRYHYVPKDDLRHIIGRGGRVIRQIEAFSGTFIFVTDCEIKGELGLEGEIVINGPRKACLLAEFAIEMIATGHFAILESLAQNGF